PTTMLEPQPTTVINTRLGVLQCLVLLTIALTPWPSEWAEVHNAMDSARSSETRLTGREGNAVTYYESLIGAVGATSTPYGDPSLHLMDKPSGWVRFQEADVVHYLDNDFLLFELKPRVQRVLFGQPFVTNIFGMHDDPITIAKPEHTFR